MGESIVKASPRGTYSEFWVKKLAVSASVPGAFGTKNDRGLQPIVTESFPWTGWERFINNPPMDRSVDICSILWVFPERVSPNSPVRINVVTYLTTSANIDVAPGPFTANV